ncbi:MAG: hypothetical protein ACREC0_04915 [Methylocella sp.]
MADAGSLAIVEHLMSNDAHAGYWTPAGLMNEDLILSLPGTSKLDLTRPSEKYAALVEPRYVPIHLVLQRRGAVQAQAGTR